jgi:hypothetical protein
VGITGFVSLVLFEVIMNAPGMLKPGEDAVEPMVVVVMPILINICYTAGSVVELAARLFGQSDTSRLGLSLFKTGLTFSLIVVWVPTVLAVVQLLVR